MSQSDAANTRPVAFFDFDGTLTTGDTLMPFLKFVVGTPTYYAKLALVSPVLAAYFAKLLRNDIAKQIVLKQYLAGYHIDDLFERGQRFSEEVIPTMLRPEGMERLRWHQEQGHECVLMSASLHTYLYHFSIKNDVDNLICSALGSDDRGVFTGGLDGKNCFGRIKEKMLKSYLEERGGGYVYAYGDSPGDIYHISMADEGFLLKNGIFVNCKKGL